MTNGLFASSTTDWDEYVTGLVDAGAVGLGLGLGVGIDEVPRGLRKACRRHRVNLFLLPAHVAFVSVSRRVIGMLYDSFGESGQEREVLLVQQELGRAAATGSRKAIVNSLASLIQATVVVHDSEGAILEGPVGAESASYPLDEVKSEISRIWRRGMYGSITPGSSGLGVQLVPLGVTGTPVAYLSLMHTGGLLPWQRSARDLAVSLLGIEIRSRHQQQDFERRVHSIAASLLLNGHIDAAQSLITEFGGSIPDPTCQVAVATGVGIDWPERAPFDRGPLVTIAADYETVVIGTETEIAELVRRLPRSAAMGVGDTVPLNEAMVSLAQARHALDTAVAGGQAVQWREVARRSISGWLGTAATEQFIAQQLGGLLGDVRLLETLRAYLVAGGSITGTALALGVHRNTVGYRMNRLRAILGDLDSASRRANLWIALEMAQPSQESRV